MNRPLAIVLALLCLGALGFGAAEWSRARQLAADLAALDTERAALRKKVWDLEKRLAASADRSRAGETASTEAAAATGESAANAGGNVRFERRGGPDGARRFGAMMDNPEFQKLMSLQQRGALDGRYADLFRRLQLSPDQLEKLKTLLVERQTATLDLIAAARNQGVNPFENPGEFREMVQSAQAEVDASIRSTIGENAYQQFRSYEDTAPQRAVVSQLEQRLSYSSTPLSSAQSDALVRILAQNAPAGQSAPAGFGANVFIGAGGGGGGARTQIFAAGAAPGGVGMGAPISDAAITQAQVLLAPAQVSALQSLQQEQQAMQQMATQIQSNFGGPRRGPGGG